MSANKHLPHLLVIPEDDANHDIVTGFRNHTFVNSRQIQVENVANGWKKAVDRFVDDHSGLMRKHKMRHVLIMIDFDRREDRRDYIWKEIPNDLKDRVFVMGSQVDPERLCARLGLSREKIGAALADECAGRQGTVWQSDMLAHNQMELERMRSTICRHLLEA
jgi:hypothetical protein